MNYSFLVKLGYVDKVLTNFHIEGRSGQVSRVESRHLDALYLNAVDEWELTHKATGKVERLKRADEVLKHFYSHEKQYK